MSHLAPTSLTDRILYAALALLGPRVAIVLFMTGGSEMRVAAWVMAAWSTICTVYTCQWAVLSYRRLVKEMQNFRMPVCSRAHLRKRM